MLENLLERNLLKNFVLEKWCVFLKCSRLVVYTYVSSPLYKFIMNLGLGQTKASHLIN